MKLEYPAGSAIVDGFIAVVFGILLVIDSSNTTEQLNAMAVNFATRIAELEQPQCKVHHSYDMMIGCVTHVIGDKAIFVACDSKIKSYEVDVKKLEITQADCQDVYPASYTLTEFKLNEH